MYIVTTSVYPNDKAKDAAKMYMKMLEKYPESASLNPEVLLVRGASEGIKAISIVEVKKGKFDGAMDFIVKRMVMFHDIPGYRYEIKTFLDVGEALALIGM